MTCPHHPYRPDVSHIQIIDRHHAADVLAGLVVGVGAADPEAPAQAGGDHAVEWAGGAGPDAPAPEKTPSKWLVCWSALHSSRSQSLHPAALLLWCSQLLAHHLPHGINHRTLLDKRYQRIIDQRKST